MLWKALKVYSGNQDCGTYFVDCFYTNFPWESSIVEENYKKSLKLGKEIVFDSCTSVPELFVSAIITRRVLIVVFKVYFRHDPPTVSRIVTLLR